MKQLNTKGFAHFLIPAILIVVGVASFGTYKVMNSFADTKAGIVQLNSEKGCWLAGRVWGKSSPKDAAKGCTKVCRLNNVNFVEKTNEHLGFCKSHIAIAFTAEHCTKDLHRYYVEQVGCARKPNQKDAVAADYCIPGYPYYNANYTNEAEDKTSVVDFCEQNKKVAQKNEAKGTPGQASTAPSNSGGGSGNGSGSGGGSGGNSGGGSTGGGSGNGSGGGQSSNTSSSNKSANFTIASYNIYYNTDDSNAAYSKSVWQDRLKKSVSVIKKYNIEVAGLQEVRAPQWLRLQAKDMLGPQYGIYPANYNAGGYASQNPVIWNRDKFTMLPQGTKTIQGPHVTLPGYYPSSNVQVLLKDKTSGKEFYVINTHEPTGGGGSIMARFNSARNRADYVRELNKTGRSLFLTGDFNAKYSGNNPRQPVLGSQLKNTSYCILTNNTNLWDARDAAVNYKGACRAQSDIGVDHVFMSRGVDAVKYDYSSARPRANGSDVHNTLIVKVRIN